MTNTGIVFISNQAMLFNQMPVLIADKCYNDDSIYMEVNDGSVSNIGFDPIEKKEVS